MQARLIHAIVGARCCGWMVTIPLIAGLLLLIVSAGTIEVASVPAYVDQGLRDYPRLPSARFVKFCADHETPTKTGSQNLQRGTQNNESLQACCSRGPPVSAWPYPSRRCTVASRAPRDSRQVHCLTTAIRRCFISCLKLCLPSAGFSRLGPMSNLRVARDLT